MANTTSVLFVGYSCRAKDDLGGLVPNWPQINEGDTPENVAIAVNKRAEIAKELEANPAVHLVKLERVIIADPQTQQMYDSAALAPKTAALTAAGWLMDHYPDAWGKTPFDYQAGPPKVSFYGFDMKLFLKLLGMGAAEIGFSLPSALWYSNSDHRDMEGALLPTGCIAKKFTVWQALKSMGMLTDKLASLPVDWQPRQSPSLDVQVAVEIASRLGLIPKALPKTVTKAKSKPAVAK